MPTSPKRPCTTPRCPHLQPCPVHPSKRQWQGRGTAEERGYGTDWRNLRAIVLARDGYSCQHVMIAETPNIRAQVCGDAATHVDHIVPKEHRGTDDPSNLRSLCATHHRTKSGREGRAAR